jgi:hypothetical protein
MSRGRRYQGMSFVPVDHAPDTSMKCYEELSRLLWRQRRLIETLLFKLEVERLLLATGKIRWLDAATVEVSTVLDHIRSEDLAREALPLATIRRRLRLGPDTTLSDIIAAAPEPWGEIYREHQTALLSHLSEVEAAAASNRELLQRGLRSTQAFLASLNSAPPADGYSRTGATVGATTKPTIFDSDA